MVMALLLHKNYIKRSGRDNCKPYNHDIAMNFQLVRREYFFENIKQEKNKQKTRFKKKTICFS